MHGYASAPSGTTYGVYGWAESPSGRGVFGWAVADSGTNYGVRGVPRSSSGYGVAGYATADTGMNYGVYGSTDSPDGHAGYFDGRLYASAAINSMATPGNHVAQVFNASTATSPDVLALKVGYAGDPGDAINFITFSRGDDVAVGAVEGNGSGGVTFKSGSGDYAEFLPRRDPQENIGPGDVVGVYDGRVSKATRGADQVLVVSSAPLVLGNDPGEEDAAGYEKVAFLGQVEVRVRGPVAAGDLLVPSGLEDGTAIGVAPAEITAEQFAQVLGQDWESSDEEDVRLVQAAVGLLGSDPTVTRMAARIESLEARLAALESTDRGAGVPAVPLASWFLPAVGTVLAGLILALTLPSGLRHRARQSREVRP